MRCAGVAGSPVGGRQHLGVGVDDGLDLAGGVGHADRPQEDRAVDSAEIAFHAIRDTGDAEVAVVLQRRRLEAVALAPAADDPGRSVVELDLARGVGCVAGLIADFGADEHLGLGTVDPGAEVGGRRDPAPVAADRGLQHRLALGVRFVSERDDDLTARLHAHGRAGHDDVVVLERGDAVVTFERVVDAEAGRGVDEDEGGLGGLARVAGLVGRRGSEGHRPLSEHVQVLGADGQGLPAPCPGALQLDDTAGGAGHRHRPGGASLGAQARDALDLVGSLHRIDNRARRGKPELHDGRGVVDERDDLGQRVDLVSADAADGSQQFGRASGRQQARVDTQALELGLTYLLRGLARGGVAQHLADDVGQSLQVLRAVDSVARAAVDHLVEQGQLGFAVHADDAEHRIVLHCRARGRCRVACLLVG